MSVAYILNNTYSYVENSKLNQELEVQTSIKAPKHYVNDLVLEKNLDGNLEITAPVVECTQINAPVALLNTVEVAEVIVDGDSGTASQVLGKDTNNNLAWISNIALPSATNYGSYLYYDSNNWVVGDNKVSLGVDSGKTNQGSMAVALGYQAGETDQAGQAISIGAGAGRTGQGSKSIAIGSASGQSSQGSNAVAIGYLAGNANQHANTLILNASGDYLNSGQTGSCYLAPVRNATLDTVNGGALWYNASTKEVNYDSTSNIVNWSNYPAVSNVDMDLNDLNNVNEVFLKSQQFSNNTDLFTFTMGNSTTEPLLPALQIESSVPYGYLKLKGRTSLELENDAGIFVPNGQIQSKLIRSVDQNTFRLTQDANEFSSTTNMNIVGMGNVECQQVIPVFNPQKTYYVAKNGNNTTGKGNIQAPYLTIQKAIDVAESDYDGTYPIIYVMEGSYTENLTISKKCIIKGVGANSDSATVGSSISGDITITFNAGSNADMFNQQVQLNGLLIDGTIEDNSGSTVNHVLNLVNCYVYSQSSGKTINFNPSGSGLTDARLWFDNCNVYNASNTQTNNLLTVNAGMMKARLTTFTNNSTNSLLLLSGTAKVDSITLCNFTCMSSSASVAPLVEISASGGNIYTFGNCAFVYSGTADKSANSNACGIKTSANVVMLLAYNTFLLAGTTTANYILKNSSGSTYTLYFSNCSGYNGDGSSQANTIEGTNLVTKRSLQAVA
ncbi:MAG TPA: hypothetical protein V6C58_23165 [Allocoleopsis sp.]